MDEWTGIANGAFALSSFVSALRIGHWILNADPRARVVVIGHADGRERAPAQIATQRATAVKDYLVTERGIEASRVTTRGVAATRPKGPGSAGDTMASNRRVEMWFVPQGAKEPDYATTSE